MKKSFALILCLVFVISIALVTCVAFIPMNVTQVADAEVDQIYGELYYKVSNISLTDLTFKGSTAFGVNSATNYGLPMRMYTSISESRYAIYNYFEGDCNSSNNTYSSLQLIWYKQNPNNTYTDYLMYIAGSAVSIYHFDNAGWYTGQYRYDRDWDKVFYTKNAVSSSFFDNNDAGFYFVNAPSVFYQSGASWQQNVFHVLEDMLSVAPSEPSSPEFDTVQRFNLGSITGYQDDMDIPLWTNELYYVELANAYLYEQTGSYNNYVDISVQYVFEDDRVLDTSFSLAPSLMLGHRYFLCLAIPHDIENYRSYNGETIPFYTTDVVGVYIWYGDSTNYVYLSDDDNSVIFGYFKDNFESLMRSGISYNAFWSGYIYGVENSGVSKNNLSNLLWDVFEFPFRILFGEYDTNINSPTYHKYVGGLFNFTVLGVDLRAFVLSVFSLAVIIGCIKIIVGLKGMF